MQSFLLNIRILPLCIPAAGHSVLPVPRAGVRIRAAYTGVAFFLFYIYISYGEKQYRRYHNYCYYRSRIHCAFLLSSNTISAQCTAIKRCAPCLVK